jgi:hypothetical protein
MTKKEFEELQEKPKEEALKVFEPYKADVYFRFENDAK